MAAPTSGDTIIILTHYHLFLAIYYNDSKALSALLSV